MMQIERLPYRTAKGLIREGDLLLWRGSRWSPVDRAIMAVGRTPYVHAGMAAEVIMASGPGVEGWGWKVLEMLPWRGGRETSLEDQVGRWPGRWDLYHANPGRHRPEYGPWMAVCAMRKLVGTRYGWWNVLRTGVRHLPIVRLLVRPLTDDQIHSQIHSGRPPYCSSALAYGYRRGGVDPVPNLSDRITEPGDLARSSFFAYVCTLG